jgi:hypothetical protein
VRRRDDATEAGVTGRLAVARALDWWGNHGVGNHGTEQQPFHEGPSRVGLDGEASPGHLTGTLAASRVLPAKARVLSPKRVTWSGG